MAELLVNHTNTVTNISKPLSPQVSEILNSFLSTVQYGQLVLVVQDGMVVKIDKIEKFIISARPNGRASKVETSCKIHPFQMKIINELQSIKFGQLVIRLDKGHVEQLEKTEKRRIHELEGLYGDGI